MRAVCQRVSRARVIVEETVTGAIGAGWLILLGIGPADTPAIAGALVDKIAGLRIFDDAEGRMNLDAAAAGAEFLIVSQFTLYADLSRGRRPGFTGAATPAMAAPLVDQVVDLLRQRGFVVATGQFGATMAVELTNDGPVTIVLTTDGWS